MKDVYRVPIILILFLIFALILVSACTQTTQSPLSPVPGSSGQTPGAQNPPGQPGDTPAGQICPQASQVWCNGRCADLSAERENCGSCGNLCPSGQICNNRQCISGNPGTLGTPVIPGTPATPVTPGMPVIPGTAVTPGTSGSSSCSAGQNICYGSCVDLQTDISHCGTCNTACPSGKVCSAGTCTVTCGSGQTNCGGSCINIQTSSQHCGKCNNACSSGQSCEKGKCGIFASPMTIVPPTGTQVVLNQQMAACVVSGKLWCSGACTSQDASNCGSCGQACKSGVPCNGGKCLSWTGTWKYRGSLVPFIQTGSTVTGSDTTSYFKFSGTTSGNPPKITATWTDGDEKGTIEFDMSADGKQFTAYIVQVGLSGTREEPGVRQ